MTGHLNGAGLRAAPVAPRTAATTGMSTPCSTCRGRRARPFAGQLDATANRWA